MEQRENVSALHSDRHFFLGDRPYFMGRKTTGVLCTCDHYQRIE